MELNKGQNDAVLSNTQQTLVLAGAGTGKTRVIIKRIERIVQEGANPTKIVATTFTNKAAAELRHRLSLSIGHQANQIICGTFHRISAFFLKNHHEAIGLNPSFQILTEDDQTKLIKRFLKQLNEEKKTAKMIIEQISQYKEKYRSGTQNNNDKFFNTIFDMYETELLQNNYLDYSDLIQKACFLFETQPNITTQLADYIMVDEYQDINSMQYNWIKLLSHNKNLFCVGDEDQAIYAFRGASIEYIQKFEQDFPQANIIKLEENYRSAQAILTGATNLIDKNPKKFKKTLIATSDKTGHIRINKTFNEYDEAQLIAKLITQWKQQDATYTIGILVRTNMQVHPIEHALVEAKIPYTITAGKKFYLKKEVQDVIAYLKVILFPHDSLAFARALNSPKRNIGEARLNLLLDAMKSLNCNFEDALTTLLPQLPRNAAEKCKILLMQIQQWRVLAKTLPIDDLTERILQDIKYYESEDFTPAQKTTLETLKTQMKKFTSLEDFLENIQFDDQENAIDIQIMTMHAAKGLEFDIVIAPGWEENLFPSPLARDNAELEEERRLAYVTITRARKYLEIMHTCSRRVNGQYKHQMPSRFLFDL